METIQHSQTSLMNVKNYGCVYDGMTDDSKKLMSIDAQLLYFPKGDIAITSEAARWLMTQNISGEGKIHILDFFHWNGENPARYTENGEIYVKDFYNPFIASLNLPNELTPATSFAHQNQNGWITNYKLSTSEYTLKSLTCWGQIYPVEGSHIWDFEKITICIGKLEFYYYDEQKKMWTEALEGKEKAQFPKLWGFYDAQYKSKEEGGKVFVPIEEGATTLTFEDHIEVTFSYGTLRGRVLHFGLDTHKIPTDEPDLLIKAILPIWIKSGKFSNELVANLGMDAYVNERNRSGADAQKRLEYCGSRYMALGKDPVNVCLAYVRNRYELVR